MKFVLLCLSLFSFAAWADLDACIQVGQAVPGNRPELCCDGLTYAPSTRTCERPAPAPTITHDALTVKVTPGCQVEFWGTGSNGGRAALTSAQTQSLMSSLKGSLMQRAVYHHLFGTARAQYCVPFQNNLQNSAKKERESFAKSHEVLTESYKSIQEIQQSLLAQAQAGSTNADSLGLSSLDGFLKEYQAHADFYKGLSTLFKEKTEQTQRLLGDYLSIADDKKFSCRGGMKKKKKAWKHRYTLMDNQRARDYVLEKLQERRFAGGARFDNFTPRRIYDPVFPSAFGYEGLGKYNNQDTRSFHIRNNLTENDKKNPKNVLIKFKASLAQDPHVTKLFNLKVLPEAVINELAEIATATFFGFGASKNNSTNTHQLYTKIQYAEYLIQNGAFLHSYFDVLAQAMPAVQSCLQAKRNLLATQTGSDSGLTPGNPPPPTQYESLQESGTSAVTLSSSAGSTIDKSNLALTQSFTPAFFSSKSLLAGASDTLSSASSSARLAGASLGGKGASREILAASDYQAKYGATAAGKQKLKDFAQSLGGHLAPAALQALNSGQAGSLGSSFLASQATTQDKSSNQAKQNNPLISSIVKAPVQDAQQTPAVDSAYSAYASYTDEGSKEATSKKALSSGEQQAILENHQPSLYASSQKDKLFEKIEKAYRRALPVLLTSRSSLNNRMQQDFEEFPTDTLK